MNVLMYSMKYASNFLLNGLAQRFGFVVLSVAFLLGLVVLIRSSFLVDLESDFNLIFKFGVKGPASEPKNVLNTIKGTFTKDMVIDPPVTVKLRLTEEELEIIHRKMVEIGFFQYPTVFRVRVPPWDSIGIVTPYSTYIFKVVSHGVVVKQLRWDDEICNENERAENLRELIRLIIEIIESKPEYQRMPKPRAGYI